MKTFNTKQRFAGASISALIIGYCIGDCGNTYLEELKNRGAVTIWKGEEKEAIVIDARRNQGEFAINPCYTYPDAKADANNVLHGFEIHRNPGQRMYFYEGYKPEKIYVKKYRLVPLAPEHLQPQGIELVPYTVKIR